MMLAFELSMPNPPSWNGKWSGEGRRHVVVESFRNRELAETLVDGSSYFYSFGDGWTARVSVRAVDRSEAGKLRRKSAGFCGYNWMISSIIRHGAIVAPSEGAK